MPPGPPAGRGRHAPARARRLRRQPGGAAGARASSAEILAAKRAMHDDLVVLTGLRLGAEQLGAEAAAGAGVPYVAVLPYPDPDAVWPAASRARFAELLAGARDEVLLQRKPPGDEAGGRWRARPARRLAGPQRARGRGRLGRRRRAPRAPGALAAGPAR